MKTMTIKELLKELRRHPDHMPVFTAEDGDYIRPINKVAVHIHDNKVMIIHGKKITKPIK